MSLDASIFSGGHGHPFAESTAALGEILEERGWRTRVLLTLEDTVASLPHTDLLVVNALYWSMTQHEKYAPFRERLAFWASDSQIDRLESWVGAGGRLLAMHTACLCFDTQPRWLGLLGGGWTWGVSYHPALGPIKVELTDGGRFELVDEVYHHLSPRPEAEVWARGAVNEGPQPVVWTRRYGEGRVALDALGHDRRSFDAPAHRALIGRLLDWLAA
jgi:type 1 glutamine amidotransferase